MRALLTGASGFLGRYVLDQLRRQGVDTVVIGRTCPGGPHGDTIQADLLQLEDYTAIVQRAQATHLLHLAWYAEHGQYWTSPLNLRWLEASVRLVEAFCVAGGQKVVAAGSCAENRHPAHRHRHLQPDPTSAGGLPASVAERGGNPGTVAGMGGG